MDVGTLNQLRNAIRRAWKSEAEHPTPLIYLFDEDGDRDAPFDALRKISSEIGVRYIKLNVTNGVTPEQDADLQRKTPRMVVISGIEMMARADLKTLRERVCSSGRTLPIVVGFAAQDDIERTNRAAVELKAIRKSRAAFDAVASTSPLPPPLDADQPLLM